MMMEVKIPQSQRRLRMRKRVVVMGVGDVAGVGREMNVALRWWSVVLVGMGVRLEGGGEVMGLDLGVRSVGG